MRSMNPSQHTNKSSFPLPGKSFLRLFLALLLLISGLLVNPAPTLADKTVEEKPPCPSWLTSGHEDFEKYRATCNYNVKRLPPCKAGTKSVNPNNGVPIVWLNRTTCTKEWTVILYMALDNDLSRAGLNDFAELFWEKANDKDYSYDVVVDIDLFESNDGTDITNQKTRGMRAVIEQTRTGAISFEQFDRYKYFGVDPNTGDPQHLEEFLMWAVEKFPARNYLLVMGGHGDGWAAMATHAKGIKDSLWQLPPPREQSLENVGVQIKEPLRLTKEDAETMAPDGTPAAAKPGALPVTASDIEFDLGRAGHGIAVDYSHKDWLSVRQIRLVLNRVSRKLLNGEPLDIFAADACYMQQAEVAYELKNVAKFIYGSIPIMESQGLPYDLLLSRIDSGEFNGAEGAQNLASALPAMMVDFYRGKNDRVMASTIRSDRLQNGLLRGLIQLGNTGSRWLHSRGTYLEDAQFAVLDAIDETINYQNSILDMKDFIVKVREYVAPMASPGGDDPTITAFLAAMDEFEQGIDDYMLSFAYGDAFQRWEGRVAGLSIWVPSRLSSFRSFIPSIANSYLHRQTFDADRDRRLPNEWTEFIAKLFSESLQPITEEGSQP